MPGHFKEVATPSPLHIVLPYEKRPDTTIALPQPSLFASEFKYWRDTYDRAVKNNDDIVKVVGSRLCDEMQFASRTTVRLIQLAETPGVQAAEASVRSWYERVTKYLGWSRLWRQIETDVLQSPSGERTTLLDSWETASPKARSMYIEQSDIEPQCGMHVVSGLFRHLFGVEPPQNETIWLKGEDVFVEAKAPAAIGVLLTERYTQSGEVLPTVDYTTARPHLSSHVWQTYTSPE